MYRVQCITNISINSWLYRVVYSCRCTLFLIAVNHVELEEWAVFVSNLWFSNTSVERL